MIAGRRKVRSKNGKDSNHGTHIEMARVDDIEIAYRSKGSGKPLFLVMGLWGTMDLWPPRMIERLARRYRVITFDNRGMGLSSSSEKPYSIELFADDVAGLVEALGYEHASVLGWSMGSCVAQELALRHPKKVDRLVLYSGGCNHPGEMPEAPEIEELLSDPGLTREKLVKSMFPQSWNEAHPDIDEYCPRSTVTTPQENLYRQAGADEAWEGSHDRLGSIACPTLVIWGMDDKDSPVQNALLLAKLIPHSWLVRISDAGHGLMYQCPERFAGIIDCFLGDDSP